LKHFAQSHSFTLDVAKNVINGLIINHSYVASRIFNMFILEQFSFECQKVIGLISITTLHNGFKTNQVTVHPIRHKTKTNCGSLAYMFSCILQFVITKLSFDWFFGLCPLWD